MKRLARFCMAPWWLIHSMTLLICMSGFEAVAQETPIESINSKESLMEGYSDNGYALRKVIPIEDLPKRIPVKKGEVSLVPDPTDRTGIARFGYAEPYMVVYLINDTDETIPRIIGELNKVRSQVKYGGLWYSRESMRLECGTVPEPEDLPARSALALGGLSDQRGDIDGEIRYLFQIPKGVVTSEPQRGRYMAGELQEAMSEEFFDFDMISSLREGLLKNKWNASMVAANLEEYCAVLELIRHYRLSLRDRKIIMDWLLDRAAKKDASREQAKAIVELKALLARPWLIQNDGQALADRCIAALEAKPSSAYGTPEKCRACVWRLLASLNGLDRDINMAWQQHKAANMATMLKLVGLARASLDSSDASMADAAASFLCSYSIKEEMFPTESLLRFLKSSSKQQVHAGLRGLGARNRMRDAAPWLLERMKANDPDLGRYYYRFRSSIKGEMEDWERAVLIHLFESNPLATLETISVSGVYGRMEKLPRECDGALRGYLHKQVTREQRKRWAAEAERDKRGQLEASHEVYCQALSQGIILLDAWNDPSDVPLLKSLLDHPAANLNTYSDGSGTLFFTARETAKMCLQRRKIAVPDSVVTRIKMKAPQPSKD